MTELKQLEKNAKYFTGKTETELCSYSIKKFRKLMYGFYKKNYRSFPWRETHDGYKILVSEIMLQQTQTYRVLDKYKAFITQFPNFESLANASLVDVLKLWQGLGYNRRAKALHDCAKRTVNEFGGVLPDNQDMLQTLPGIGPYTACAVNTFTFNRSNIFIETNIRTIYLYYFFSGKKEIHDQELMPVIEKTMDKKDPRNWYYALMDYGVWLKKMVGNQNKQSKHYKKQSKFEGSNRQVRGQILKALLTQGELSIDHLKKILKKDKEIIKNNLWQMEKEGLLCVENNILKIK